MVLFGQGLWGGAVVGVEERRAWKNRQLKAGEGFTETNEGRGKGCYENLWAFLNE